MLKTAIVILNWNGVHFLRDFLPGVINNSVTSETKVFVADNGSSDDSISFIKELLEDEYIIKLDKNYGFALGYKLALEKIKAEYFVLLNSDVEVTENWIKPVIGLMEKDQNIAASMPKIKSFDNRNYFEYAGGAGGFIDKFGYPFCRGRIITEIEIDKGQYDDVCQIFWATGACLFVRSATYFEVGGLDGDFFAHMEEIDLCWRINNAGYKVIVQPAVTVYHVGGGTLPNNNPRKIYYNFRNSLFMLYKNLPGKNFKRTLLFRLTLDGFAALKFLLTGQIPFFMAVIKAHTHFWISLRNLEKKRKFVKTLIADKRAFQPSPVFLLTSFFIKKRKTFNDLTNIKSSNV